MEITYSEIECILDLKFIDASSTENTQPTDFYEFVDVQLDVKVFTSQ